MTETVADGGEPRGDVGHSVANAGRTRSNSSPSTGVLLVVAILGNLVGFLLALAAGLGEPGSLPVTAVSVLVGGIAVASGMRWWPAETSYSRRSVANTDADDLETLGRWVHAVSDEFEVEIEDDVLRVRQKERT